MMEIAVVGDSEFALGFKLAGLSKVYEVSTDHEDRLKQIMSEQNIGIVLIDDKTMANVSERTREALFDSVKPAVVVLSRKDTAEDLRRMIRRSIGVDLWGE